MKATTTKKSALLRSVLMALAVTGLCGALAACAPQSSSSKDDAPGTETEEQAVMGEQGMMYESDAQCLSCHGNSYEALASMTASYGLSNPHNSIHGGYNSCGNCHAKDKEITDNKCDNCHTWPHNPETGPGVDLQNAPQ